MKKSMISRFLTPAPELPRERQLFSNAALKKMIIPLLIEQLLQMVVGLVDTMMVSYAGEATVSGVSLDTMIYSIFIYLFSSIATGGAVVVSQYIGNNDRKSANRSASQVFFITTVVSTSMMVLILLLGNSILALLYPSVERDVMEACRTYLWIVALSFPANAIYNAGAALYRSMGKTRVTMYVSISMNLINVAGNAIGIFILRAGAAGVAWPTTISWYFAAVVMTVLCFNKRQTVNLEVQNLLRPYADSIKRIMRIAIPNMTENTLYQAAKVVLGALVATFGTSQIAANGIGQTFFSISAIACIAMGQIFITVIGQCIGAGDTDAAQWYMHKLTRLSLLMAFVWNVAVVAALPFLLPLYDIAAETRGYIWVIVIIHNVFAGLVQPFSGPLCAGLQAAGDVKYTMWSSVFSTVICRTAFSFILGSFLGMGVIGVAAAMGIDWSIKAVLIVIRFRNGKWKNFKVI